MNKKYKSMPFIIENGDYSYSALKGISISDDLILLKTAQAFRKDTDYNIDMFKDNFLYNNEINKVF